MSDKNPLSKEQFAEYWRRTSNLMWTLMIIWAIFGYVVPFFAAELNRIVIFGFPLGFYFGAQGSLIVFVVICFWNAFAQDKIDDEFGVSDE
ncbi:MAG: DUF4212 domain-containing protein [Alphaproteobacteria bacterium]|nr:DUF4212 domain-containing protein [Alphaproteobacteria bacterium]